MTRDVQAAVSTPVSLISTASPRVTAFSPFLSFPFPSFSFLSHAMSFYLPYATCHLPLTITPPNVVALQSRQPRESPSHESGAVWSSLE